MKQYEECTFAPNVRSKSSKKNKTSSHYKNINEFLDEQTKREEERLMKLNLQHEMIQMERMQHYKGQPQINKTSRKLVEKKKEVLMFGKSNDVHNRLYDR